MAVDRNLLDVLGHDLVITRIERLLANMPEAESVRSQEQRRDELDARTRVLTETKQGHERERNRLEGEIGILNGRIDTVKEKLFGGKVTTPKELSALQADQEMLERNRGVLEDEELEVLVALDDVAPELEQTSAALRACEDRLEELRSDLERATSASAADLVSAREAREQSASSVEAEVLAVYEKVRERDGVGAAAYEGGRCGACRLELTPAARVDMSEAVVPLCPNCGVVLVVAE